MTVFSGKRVCGDYGVVLLVSCRRRRVVVIRSLDIEEATPQAASFPVADDILVLAKTWMRQYLAAVSHRATSCDRRLLSYCRQVCQYAAVFRKEIALYRLLCVVLV